MTNVTVTVPDDEIVDGEIVNDPAEISAEPPLPWVAYAEGLRRLADFCETQADKLGLMTSPDTTRADVYCFTRAELAQRVRALGGRWDKEASDYYYKLVRDFGGGVSMELYTSRSNVCEKKQVGTKTVTVPDPEWVKNNPPPMVQIDEPVYEWDCGSLSDAVELSN